MNDGIVTRKTWLDSHGNNDVILYVIENWGHKWPGRYFSGQLEKDDPFRDFNAADIIWDLFKKHSR